MCQTNKKLKSSHEKIFKHRTQIEKSSFSSSSTSFNKQLTWSAGLFPQLGHIEAPFASHDTWYLMLEQLDGKSSEYLYPPEILQRLDFKKSPAVFKPEISAAQPGEEWMVVRPLQRSDFDKGFLQLLGQLTNVGNVSRKQFDDRFTKMKQSGGYYVTVIEDTRIQKLIGAATLTVEQKFIHNCSLRGRLEDVVVNDTYRGKQLGKLIVVTVSLLAQEVGCYKMSLDCKDKLIKFYETLGYKMEPGNSNAMNMRFDDPS